MKEKILFLVESEFSKRDFDRFGVENFISLGFDVKALWLNLRKNEPTVNYLNFQKKNTEFQVIEFKSIDKIEEYLKSKKDCTFCFLMFELQFRYRKVYNAITANNIPYGILRLGQIPSNGNATSHLLKANIFKSSWYLDRIYKRYLIYLKKMRAIDFIAKSGSKTFKYNYPSGPTTRILILHSFDYEATLRSKSLPLSEDHIVFVDEYQPFHPDFENLNIAPPNAENYYTCHRLFFDYLEKELGLPIVIAAHPRSTYLNPKAFFGDRECIKGETQELIRKASLVLVNASTAVSFAVIYNKPVISLTSNDMIDGFLGNAIQELSKSIGSPLVNLDAYPYPKIADLISVDQEKYQQYKHEFICPTGSGSESLWNTVSNEIRRAMKKASLE